MIEQELRLAIDALEEIRDIYHVKRPGYSPDLGLPIGLACDIAAEALIAIQREHAINNNSDPLSKFGASYRERQGTPDGAGVGHSTPCGAGGVPPAHLLKEQR